MADLKLKLEAEIPATLQHRAIIAVGTDTHYDLYIGKTDNTPILLTRLIGSLSVTLIDDTDSPYDLEVLADNTIVLVDASSDDVVVNLPSVAEDNPVIFTIKREDSVGANDVTVTPDGAETIDGAASYVVSGQYDAVTLVSDGVGWHIISKI